MEIGNGTFLHGDCLELMRDLPSGSVDMVMTSPPYDNLRTYNGMPPFTFDVFAPIADELARVLEPGGVIVWNVADATVNGSETGSSFRQALYFKDQCGLNLHDTMIWAKEGSASFGSNNAYSQSFEYMFILSKGKPRSINLIADRENVIKSGMANQTRVAADGTKAPYRKVERKPYGKRNNVWFMKPERGSDHPAPFPISIPQDHILSWPNPGDTILDPFAGSGTTAIAAENAGRKWICMERDPTYYESAIGRVYEHVAA